MHTVDELFRRVPEGWSVMRFDDRRYGVTRTVSAGGRIQKLYAEELGGPDVVSANLYASTALRPCEMPAAKVLAFVSGAVPAEPGTTVGFAGNARARSSDGGDPAADTGQSDDQETLP